LRTCPGRVGRGCDQSRALGSGNRAYGPFYPDVSDPDRSLHFWHGNLEKPIWCWISRIPTDGPGSTIEGFSPGIMERMGFGYDRLQEINRGIIYAQQSGIGQVGKYGAICSYGHVADGLSGLTERSGLPEPNAPAGFGYSQSRLVRCLQHVEGYDGRFVPSQKYGTGMPQGLFSSPGRHLRVPDRHLGLQRQRSLFATSATCSPYTPTSWADDPRFPVCRVGSPTRTHWKSLGASATR
jgi:hypothetical protein